LTDNISKYRLKNALRFTGL